MGHSSQNWSIAAGALRLNVWGIATKRLEHCDYVVGALRLVHSGRGAFRPSPLLEVSGACMTARLKICNAFAMLSFNAALGLTASRIKLH